MCWIVQPQVGISGYDAGYIHSWVSTAWLQTPFLNMYLITVECSVRFLCPNVTEWGIDSAKQRPQSGVERPCKAV